MPSDRDLAYLLWLVVPAAVFLMLRSGRRAVAPVAASLLSAPIVVVVTLALTYVGSWLWLLEKISLWRVSDWPETALWFFGTALVSIFNTKEYAERPVTLWELIRGELGVVVLVQFIAGAYSLPFALDFVLVPVIFFLALIGALAMRKPETASVGCIANGLLALLSIGFILYGAIRAILDLTNFASLETARDFFMPIALGVSLTPALVALAYYMTFERLGVQARYVFPNEALRRYTMARVLIALRFSPERVARFFLGLHRGELADRDAVDARLANLRDLLRREADPTPVDPAEGWSPILASRFLAKEGLEARNWRNTFDRWTANAPAVNVGRGHYSAFFEYYVEGDEHVARRLRLVGYVQPAEDTPAYRERFVVLALVLASAAIGEDSRAALEAPLQRHEPFEVVIENRLVSFRIDTEGVANGASVRVAFKIDFQPGYDLPP